MVTETVTAVPRVRVRKGGVPAFPWVAVCKACPSAHRPLTGEQARLSHAGINTPIGWKSQSSALRAALRHLHRWHAPAEPPC